jgi:hypothetical protein
MPRECDEGLVPFQGGENHRGLEHGCVSSSRTFHSLRDVPGQCIVSSGRAKFSRARVSHCAGSALALPLVYGAEKRGHSGCTFS